MSTFKSQTERYILDPLEGTLANLSLEDERSGEDELASTQDDKYIITQGIHKSDRVQRKTAKVACFQLPYQSLILVKPGFASGAFGNCSVWLGTKDKKLYIRKISLNDIEQTTRKPPIEEEIRLTPDHPNVPRIVHSVNHEGGPNPTEFGIEFQGELIKHGWSIFSDFVNGPTLEQLTIQHSERQQRFPEWMVWKCGHTLLKVLHKIQCQNVVHSDIRSRNILVSSVANEDGKSHIDFHLIDFGIAQQVDGWPAQRYRDASLIAEVLFCMLLGKSRTEEFKACEMFYEQVKKAAEQPGWPYSKDIVDAIWNMHDVEMRSISALPIKLPNGIMRKWLTRFSDGVKEHKSDDELRINPAITDRQPLFLADRDFISLTLGGSPACCPFKKAEVDTETLEVISVSEQELWGQHFANECWKSYRTRVRPGAQEVEALTG